MKSLIVFLAYNSSSYFIPILLALKKMNKKLNCCLVGNFSKKSGYENYYDLLKKNGVIFLSDSEFKAHENSVYFLDYNLLPSLYKRVGKNITTITYYHGSDRDTLPVNTHHIFTQFKQIQTICQNNGIQPSYKPIQLQQYNSEIFVGGFYHYFEVFPYLKNSNKKNQEILAKKLDMDLDLEKPLISYTFGEYNREYKFIKTFKKLSEHYNFIVKVLYPDQAEKLRKENILVCERWREPLLRIASDVNLVALGSGSLESSFAFGLRTIPVYSDKMGIGFPLFQNNFLFRKDAISKSFAFFLNKKPIYAKPYTNDFLYTDMDYYKLVPPVCLYDFEQLQAVIDNKGFWKGFEKKVEIERKKVFGEIILEDSVKRTSEYVLSVLSK